MRHLCLLVAGLILPGMAMAGELCDLRKASKPLVYEVSGKYFLRFPNIIPNIV